MSDQPFTGITVIEFGQFVAVPYCAQLLAEGGAKVIKVEPLEGDPTRHNGVIAPYESRYFIARSRGKHSLPLDLRHPRAARILDALFSKADVALMNLRPGLAPELGLDFATLSAKYPRLIVGNVTAFGKEGPDAQLAGMDLVVQARSGLMAAMGRMREGLPAAGDSPIADYMAAVMLAFGVATALYRRESTGIGGEVDVSLLGAAMALANNVMVRVDAVDAESHANIRQQLADARDRGAPFTEQASLSPLSRATVMSSVFYRAYDTKDSTLAVACVSGGLQRRLLQATGMTERAKFDNSGDRAALAQHYADLQAAMEALFRQKTTAEWQEVLNAAGVPASPVRLPIELHDDPQPLANGLMQDVTHPELGTARVFSTPVRLDGDGFRTVQPTAAFGSETRTILADAGLSSDEVEACVAEGAVGERT